VGSCAQNFGLGKAVVLHAIHQMKAAGMDHATVANAGTKEASRALYAACGFTPWHLIDDYVKPASARWEYSVLEQRLS
jgi:L-amino acid N-acyltransferase YncA